MDIHSKDELYLEFDVARIHFAEEEEEEEASYIVSLKDITERKRAEVLLRESEEKFRSIFETANEGICVLDEKENILSVNQKFADMLGHTINDLLNNNFESLLFEEDLEDNKEKILERRDGKNGFYERRLRKKDGSLIWCIISASPIIASDGSYIGSFGLLTDITDRKQMEQDLIAAKEKAEEMNRVKSHFFANMSHELRTPFVGIKGYSELLSETITDPESKEMIDGIIDSSNRLIATLNKILSLTKLEFDRPEIELKEFNLKNVLEDSFKLFSKTAEMKNLLYTKNIFSERSYGDEQIIVKSDERLLREILDNLLSNAIKYTEKGSIELRSEIEKKEEGEYLFIKVSDTGIGIPEDKKELIWHEFRQVSEGVNRAFEGTGLGLTIAKRYVELLGGKISVESELGKGSTFIVELPLQRIVKVEQPTTIKNQIDETFEMIKSSKQQLSKTILFVENDKNAQDLVSLTLSKYYKLEIVSNAKEAFEKVKNQKYDALLIDINLGHGMDGAQLMEMIRKIPEYKETPMIAITVYAADSDREEFLSRGFTHYISKPFPLKDLIKLVSEVFS